MHFTFQKHYNMITLHRPYLIAALLDLKAQEARQTNGQDSSSFHNRTPLAYLRSLDTSVRAAETILDTMEEAISSQYPGVHVSRSILFWGAKAEFPFQSGGRPLSPVIPPL
jgi:hypothetical protein